MKTSVVTPEFKAKYLEDPQHPGLFDSISIILQDPELNEEPYIDQVNRALGLVGHKAMLDVDFMLEQLQRATWHYDFPLSLPNCLGIYLLAKQAHARIPRAVSAVEEPAPVRRETERYPHRHAECAGQMRNRRVGANDQVQILHDRGAVHELAGSLIDQTS